MSLLQVVLIVLAGVATGTINTVVGSGTLLTVPTLLAFGGPSAPASVDAFHPRYCEPSSWSSA